MGKEEKKPARDKPPRPRNAWMLFLCAYHDERKAMREPPLIDPETAKHTKIVSERWKNLPMSEKEKWHAKAEQEKEDHAARYPGYKYQPSKHKKQRTFYGGPRAQRKLQGLVHTAQAKIQQDIGGRLIWVDVAENGQSIAGQVELYDAPPHSAIPSSTVGIHPYDHVLSSASHSPIFLRPVAQYTGPLSERTNSPGPDSDEEDAYGSAPPESDWEHDYADEDDAELQTPDSATYPRRDSAPDSLRIVMTVQNRLGTLTEVDAGVLPSDPGRPLSPPIPVMQLIRDSRGAQMSGGGQRRDFAPDWVTPEETDRYPFMPSSPSGRGRSHSTPTLYSSLSPSPQSTRSPSRSARTPHPPTTTRPRSSERYRSGPPLASPLAPPLSAQPYVRSPYHTHAHYHARRYRDYPPSPSRYVTYREHPPHSAHPYYRVPDGRHYAHSARRPLGPVWLPPPESAVPPPPPARRPSWLPSVTRPMSPSSPYQVYVSRPAESSVHVKKEDVDEDMDIVGVVDIPVKRELEGEDVDELDEDQYPVHRVRLASNVAADEGTRANFQLAPIRSPPSSPKGDTRLPPIQIPRTPSPNLSPRSLPASAYLKGPAPGSLGQYSPQRIPPASAGSYRFGPASRATGCEELRERAAQDSRATPSVTHAEPAHASAREHKTHPVDPYGRGRKHARVSEHHEAQIQRMQSPVDAHNELRSPLVAETATTDTCTLRPARF